MTGQAAETTPPPRKKSWLWLAASVAASLLVIAAIFAPSLLGNAPDANADGLAELRKTLRAEPENIWGNWLRTLNPKMQDVQGDLVWSPAKQQGVMRFINLPAPPANTYYQLWLYDIRNIKAPVSGAKFTQGSGKGEWYAAIYPETHIDTPYKFELKLESGNKNTPALLMLMVQP